MIIWPVTVKVSYVSPVVSDYVNVISLIRDDQVKADRGEIKDAQASIKKLQEDSAKAAQREKDGEK